MVSRRVFMVVAFYVFVCASREFLSAGSGLPMGILTRAYDAQLNSSQAYAGLSVFEGEALSMGKEGKLGVRVGVTNLAFSQGAQATLQRITKGTHVDMLGGAVFFAAPESAMVEIHIADAFLRPEGNQATQAEVKMMEPKVPQVSAMHGNLELRYRIEFQPIPEGETYRIYLDGPAEPQKPAGGTTVAKHGISHRVVIYMLQARWRREEPPGVFTICFSRRTVRRVRLSRNDICVANGRRGSCLYGLGWFVKVLSWASLFRAAPD